MRRALAVCCASTAAALDHRLGPTAATRATGRRGRRRVPVGARLCAERRGPGKGLAAADALKPFFAVTDDAVALEAADPSAALKEAFDALRAQDAIPMLRGWRDEPFAAGRRSRRRREPWSSAPRRLY